MFSLERVTPLCMQYGLTPGQAMDIKNGYDVDLASDRKRAWASIEQDKPQLIIGSPRVRFSRDCKNFINRCTAMMLRGWLDSTTTSSKLKDM